MFSKFPPSISVPLFYAYITVAFVVRFFIGNIYGIFLLCLLLHNFSPQIFGITPFSISQLFEWIASQSEATKTALLSSFITVIGFMIAFATATYNWKAQSLAQLRLQAAGEIDMFFNQCSRLTTDCEIYSDALIEAVDKIQKNCGAEEARFLAYYNREQSQKFLQNRQQLSALGTEVHRLQGRYTNLLVLTPGLKTNMELAVKALSNITEHLWFNAPHHIENDDNPVQTFINQVNVSDCMAFSKAAEDNFGQLNFTSGGVKGTLQASVVGFSLWSMIFIYKEKAVFKQAIQEHYNACQKNG